ncbi:MAG: OsmC family protein [Leptolyngbya sp.]|nr:OsmC family protein [Leptolyngbya sp.]
MQIHVYHEGKLRFRACARGHSSWADQPFALNGQDSGMTPTEWLLAALGSCMGMAAVRYLDKQNLNSQGLQLSLRADVEHGAVNAATIHVHVVLEAALNPQQRQQLKTALNQCELFRILQHPPHIKTEILASLPQP